MKLHELRPADGAVRKKTRVGRGIAAGGGKTAGRGTKGQKSRAGSSIPAWFEGGQTPLHIRIPKLRGFRNINRIEYEIVNVGAIAAAVVSGRLVADGKGTKGKSAPVTVNADLLRDAGLVRDPRKPLKVLGGGDVGVSLFVVADAFTRSAREKIEGAGGTAQLLEVPTEPLAALGVDRAAAEPAESAPTPARSRGRASSSESGEAEHTASAQAAAEPERAETPETSAEAPPAEATAEAMDPEATAEVEEEAAGSAEPGADA